MAGDGGGVEIGVVGQRVLLQVIRARETFTTMITLVLALPGVYSEVSVQLVRSCKFS